ncbi:hypothetical protein IC617_08875 [Neiella sp. HB171785]|uniref:Uncharacterized protein n=1 Tax=Neiella litorisoli TaxID=2771431 RepID=A0A8J6QH85_9GAMM|nr:hypothetical protein [Neiella litorisoli]MBD1389540.1 hypothetical protein [Neiella litorisoli]
MAHRVANDLQRHLDSQCQLQLTKHEIMANAPAFGQLAAILLFIDDEQLYARQLAKVSCPILSFADAVQAPTLKEPTS